eukprot:TRINITY_DN24336_c0_g1_i2.p1 TRINITY_DN24336_c0_g1~~TRINITY_DN24336_c0_g1_i2.p1  ORF type:complete len:216 (-),score=10.42 TRINITY_DN24336_c0_g1_i2:141-788(-)
MCIRDRYNFEGCRSSKVFCRKSETRTQHQICICRAESKSNANRVSILNNHRLQIEVNSNSTALHEFFKADIQNLSTLISKEYTRRNRERSDRTIRLNQLEDDIRNLYSVSNSLQSSLETLHTILARALAAKGETQGKADKVLMGLRESGRDVRVKSANRVKNRSRMSLTGVLRPGKKLLIEGCERKTGRLNESLLTGNKIHCRNNNNVAATSNAG